MSHEHNDTEDVPLIRDMTIQSYNWTGHLYLHFSLQLINQL